QVNCASAQTVNTEPLDPLPCREYCSGLGDSHTRAQVAGGVKDRRPIPHCPHTGVRPMIQSLESSGGYGLMA
ncbi:MAG: hypothetical protein ABWX89_10260, partial [Paeniglutamicibacter terrestris]